MLTVSYAASQLQKSMSEFLRDHAMASTPRGEIKWTSSAGEHIGSTNKPTAKYGVLSDGLRQITPGSWQCSMFCGGRNCKYCNPSKGNWPPERMVVKGLFSEWITDDIIAISRPSTDIVDKFDIIGQFKKLGITSIVNLQRPGEHSSCGNTLEEESGFSYLPQTFMDNDVFFYNFGWDDYGVRSLPSILDMVKVMSFALQEGKAAVHCHAGLGRTGVLIACYLIYAKRMEADQVIHFVREKRPGAIQTKGQVECCQQFGKFLIPLRVVFSSVDPCAYAFTLSQYLIRQKHMLHGYEARELKYIPKIVHVVCKRLAELANSDLGNYYGDFHLPLEKKLEIEKETAGNAFSEQRNKQRSAFDIINDNPIDAPGESLKLPPIRKSKSAESLVPDSEMNGDNDLMKVPLPKRMPGSPNLRFRSHLEHTNAGSSGSDDEPLTTRSESYMGIKRAELQRELNSQDSRENLMSTAMSIDAGLISGKNKRPVRKRFSRGPLPRRSSILSQISESLSVHEDNQDIQVIAKAMAFNMNRKVDQHERVRVDAFQNDLNATSAAWNILSTEEDPYVLCGLMYSWLEHLKEPVLSVQDLHNLVEHTDDPKNGIRLLDKGERHTLECVMKTLAKLQPLPRDLEQPILQRILKAFTGKAKINASSESLNEEKNIGVKFLQAYLEYLRERQSADDLQSESASVDSQSLAGDEMSLNVPSARRMASSPILDRSRHLDETGSLPKSNSDPNMPVPARKNNTLPPIK
ncbi:protein tyrosine phosphatase domain-containing protein 1-like isoform X2 [Ptychodera flava]|uniref:protein tyrosine phosphatase domain-containing protein 1-like isoform X2 n=2 Tax=Ptychodera flava TaxID=63121 RepID=UPI003969E21A